MTISAAPSPSTDRPGRAGSTRSSEWSSGSVLIATLSAPPSAGPSAAEPVTVLMAEPVVPNLPRAEAGIRAALLARRTRIPRTGIQILKESPRSLPARAMLPHGRPARRRRIRSRVGHGKMARSEIVRSKMVRGWAPPPEGAWCSWRGTARATRTSATSSAGGNSPEMAGPAGGRMTSCPSLPA